NGLLRVTTAMRSAGRRNGWNGGAVMSQSQPNATQTPASSNPNHDALSTGAATFLAAGSLLRPDSQFRHVLLADDDTATRRIIARILETAGYHVTQSADGQAALEALRANPPDFLVTDWQMPGMDGLEL